MSCKRLRVTSALPIAMAAFLGMSSSNTSAAVFHPSQLGGPFSGSTSVEDGAELFAAKDNDGSNDDIVSAIYLENAAYARFNSFGLYQLGKPLNTLQIFSGSDGASSFGAKTVLWTGDHVCVLSGGSCAGPQVSGIDKDNFGFYITSPEGTFYSQKSANDDGFDHMVSYYVGGTSGADYVLGFEDLYGGGDRDYNDMVVGVHDIVALSRPADVPIPGAVWLLGSAMFGIVTTSRRHSRAT